MSTDIKKFRKQVKLVEEIRVNWNEKMKELQTKVFDEKDLVNVKEDVFKLKDLEFLKSQNIPGPFAPAEVLKISWKKLVNRPLKTNECMWRCDTPNRLV